MPDYTVVSELGRGGMGVVYRARQISLDREVAIKFLLDDFKDRPHVLKRFQREVMACTKLNHPHIIKVLDSGEDEGRHYYVMEFLADACPLDNLIKAEGPFPPQRALTIALQLLEALDYCHGHKLVHRDLKPANIMMRPGDHAILMDFGLARDLGASTMLTEEGAALGTPRFVAPEMFKGEPASVQTDLWALGATLYEMLTKTRAFTGKNYGEIGICVLKTEPAPMHSLVPALPPDLDAVVRRFLKKDPAERLATARQAIRVIRDWMGEDAPPLPSPAGSSGVRSRPSRRITVPSVVIAAPPHQRRGARIAVAVALCVAAGLFAFAGRERAVAPVVASPAGPSTESAAAAPEGPAMEEVAARLRRAVEKLDPRRTVAALATAMRPAYRARAVEERQKRWAPEVPAWQQRLDAALAASGLDRAAAEFERVKDRFYRASGVAAAAKLATYAAVCAERELEEEARSAQLRFPSFAPRLFSPEYGQGVGPLAGAPGACLSLLKERPSAAELDAGKPLTMLLAAGAPADHFFDYTSGEGAAGMEGQLSRGAYAHADAIELGGPLLRVSARLDTLRPEDCFRVLIATRRPASAKDYRLIAELRSASRSSQKVSHAIPAGIVPAGGVYVRVELACAPRSRRTYSDQEGRLNWLLLSWR